MSGLVLSKKALDFVKRVPLLMFFFAFANFLFVFRRTTIGIREKRCKFVAETREGERFPSCSPEWEGSHPDGKLILKLKPIKNRGVKQPLYRRYDG
jgi:hypothetical protein